MAWTLPSVQEEDTVGGRQVGGWMNVWMPGSAVGILMGA